MSIIWFQNSLQNETAAPEELISNAIDGSEDCANEVLNENDENNGFWFGK